MTNEVGPRRRVVTLRIPRKVFYELTAWCEARGLSLQSFLEGHVCCLGYQAFILNLSPSDQEVQADG